MKQFSKELGKVSITPKGDWDSSITNERLDIVYDRRNNQAYIAKQDVPIGVDIDNREYWQPLNVSGYADNNFINLTTENENGTITAYDSLEEAVATIFPINRRVGATLSFYNLNSDRLDRQAEFELWQFNSTDLANWENKDYWNNIYYNWNVFAGWYIDADALTNHVKLPNVGQYAYVGSNLNDALLYQCRTNGTWTNTGIKVRNYISVVVSGNITIGDNGNWFSDGEDTGIPATPAVDEQLDNIITKHESLSRTVQGIAATGGASTATNVTYNNDASGLNAENTQDAIDELQGSKIDKTSILQELGEAEDKVMSQKTVSTKLSNIHSTISLSGISTAAAIRNGSTGNFYNERTITTDSIAVKDLCNRVAVYTDRPVDEGCVYIYTFLLSSSEESVGKLFATNNNPNNYEIILAENFDKTKVSNVFNLSKYPTAKSIAVCIAQYRESDNTFVALRRENFEKYKVLLKFYTYDVNVNVKVENNIRETKNIFDGGCFNPSNPSKVHSIGIDVRNFSAVCLYTNRPKTNSKNTYIYELLGVTEIEAINKDYSGAYTQTIKKEEIPEGTNLIIPNSTSAIFVGIYEKDEIAGKIVPLRKEDFSGYVIGFIRTSILTEIFNIQADVNNIQADVNNIHSTISLSGISTAAAIRNGSTGNFYNERTITTDSIAVKDLCNRVAVYTDRPVDEGCVYIYTFLLSSSEESVGKLFATNNNPNNYEIILAENFDKTKVSNVFNLSKYPTAKSIAVCIAQYRESDNTFVALRRENFEKYKVLLKFYTEEQYVHVDDIYTRHKNKEYTLMSACKFTHKLQDEISKDFMICEVTDSHSDNVVVKNSVIATNNFLSIDALIHCGDVMASVVEYGANCSYLWKDIVAGCKKPFYFVVGNHEAGTFPSLAYTPTDKQLYENFIKPSVDAGYLLEGEYTINKCYYYHDFNKYELRLIVLDEYEAPFDFDETYWKCIPYDSSISLLENNHDYNTGDKINIKNFTDHSFSCVQTCNSGDLYSSNYNNPRLKCQRRGYRCILKEQAQWFLDTLNDAAEKNYAVVVAMHNPFSDNAKTQPSLAFSQSNIYLSGDNASQNNMETDFIAESLNAFINGGSLNLNVVMKGDCEYLNGNSGYYYNVNKTFNKKGKLYGILGGHVHKDLIWKHNIYSKLVQITPICANTNNAGQYFGADIYRDNSNYGDFVDSLTCISFNENRIALVKIGNDTTSDGYKRDFEILSDKIFRVGEE